MTEEKADIFAKKKKIEIPSWYACNSITSATVDLGDFVEGAFVTLRSPKKREMRAVHVKPAGPEMTTAEVDRVNCGTLVCYIDEFTGIEADSVVCDAAPPERGAKVADWVKWAEGCDNKMLARIHLGIDLFYNDYKSDPADSGATGNA